MITLSIEDNLIFLIDVLDQTVDELKSNANKLKSFINIKKETLILKKISKYIYDLEKSESNKLKFQLKSDRTAASSSYFSFFSNDKYYGNNDNNTDAINGDRPDSFRSCATISSIGNMIFGITGLCTSSNLNQGTTELNLSKLSLSPTPIEANENDNSPTDYNPQFDQFGCQTFTRINNFNSTAEPRPTNSLSFCTINESNSLALSREDLGVFSDYDITSNTGIMSDCMLLNAIYKKEKTFLIDFNKACQDSLEIFEEIINETNKFKFYIKTEIKDILSRYLVRDKHWSKVRTNFIKNYKHLEQSLDNSNPPYIIEGDAPGIVTDPGVKSILSYIRYINSEREWQQVLIKAKAFIMQLENSFIKLFIDFVNHFNDKIYIPSCKILNIFATLSQSNNFNTCNYSFSTNSYNTSQSKTFSQQYIKKCSKLRKIKGLLTKYFILRYEKLELDTCPGSLMPQFYVAGVDISSFFFAMQTYYKLNKIDISEYRKKSFRSGMTSPKLSYSNSSGGIINVTSNTNKQLSTILMELLTFDKFKPSPIEKIFVETLCSFREGIPDEFSNFVNLLKQHYDNYINKKDSESEASDSDEAEVMENKPDFVNDNHNPIPPGIRLLDKWIDPSFCNACNVILSDKMKEYSKSIKFQAEARLCYHNNDLNLNFEKDDIVKVYEPVGDIWWGSFNGIDGPFPAKCLETRWIAGLCVDYDKETELDLYITPPDDETAYPTDTKDVGISLFDKFNIPETCLGSFSCALHKKILLQGKLYTSKSYLVFCSHFNDNTLFGEATIQIIPITSIKSVRKGDKNFFSQSIQIDCLQNIYIFSSFINRNKVLKFINLLIRLKSPPEHSNKLQLVYDPFPVTVKLNIPDELRKYDIFKDGYKQLELMIFYLTTPMPFEDVFGLLFDLSQPPHRSVRESVQHDDFFYSVDDGPKIDALQDSDGLKINYPESFPGVTKRTLYYSIKIKQSSLNQMLGVPTTGDVTEVITAYFIDESNILIESDTKVAGVPLSDSFHSTWHILLKNQGHMRTMSGFCQVFIDHWIPFSNKVMVEAQTSIKSALSCFADVSFKKMST